MEAREVVDRLFEEAPQYDLYTGLRIPRRKKIKKIPAIRGIFRGRVHILADVKPKRAKREPRPRNMTEHETIRWMRVKRCEAIPKPAGKKYEHLEGPCLIIDAHVPEHYPVIQFRKNGENVTRMAHTLSLAEDKGMTYEEVQELKPL